MLKWAAARDYLTAEPWRAVDLPAKGDARTRVLSATEIRWLWLLTDRWMTKNTNLARIARLLLLTGQRSSEVCGMERQEFTANLLEWNIPGRRCKNGQQHTVPLAPMVRAIVADAIAESPSKVHLFVGPRGKPARPDDLAHELADCIKAHNEGKPKTERIAAFTPHDLRRTTATALEKMGVPLTIISALLNHISAKASSVTTAHYTHSDLSMEVRAALTRWQATVERVLAGDDPFVTKVEDIEELERRMLAKGFGGRAYLRTVR
jgi:integrase